MTVRRSNIGNLRVQPERKATKPTEKALIAGGREIEVEI